ncbi:hypothetical protein POX_g09071 [Penicillium oxalicum]|uniref:hypothetical protein n=1 Tax=Penicillium oxalicum TaxID=69781 RepID=UPI0020B7BC06|nr:hypothetical protein POX_g09071 [Penicillium oxalicum]KAI2786683.1 hypothetical protein POX_g09071 [Penicillium oxalicum]
MPVIRSCCTIAVLQSRVLEGDIMHKSYQDQLLCEMIFCDRSSGALRLFNPHRLDPPLRAVSKERDLAVNRDEHSLHQHCPLLAFSLSLSFCPT